MRCRYVAGLPAHPGEQSPVGAASPAALQYFPGGQGSQPPLLDTPVLTLKLPAGHGKATPDGAPVDQCPSIRPTDGPKQDERTPTLRVCLFCSMVAALLSALLSFMWRSGLNTH